MPAPTIVAGRDSTQLVTLYRDVSGAGSPAVFVIDPSWTVTAFLRDRNTRLTTDINCRAIDTGADWTNSVVAIPVLGALTAHLTGPSTAIFQIEVSNGYGEFFSPQLNIVQDV